VSELSHVTDEDFESEVLKSDVPMMVDLSAEWCGPCKALAPIVEQIAEEQAGKVKVCKMDVDQSQKYAAQLGIRSIPTLLVFHGGKVVDQVIGAVPKEQITEKLDAVLEG